MSHPLPAILGGPPIRPSGPPDWPGSNPQVTAALGKALADGSWGKYHGPHVGRLTEILATAHECEFVSLCASGTSAVELALRGLGVGANDEVVLAAYDFKANFQNVLTVGATPVLVDIRPDNWNMDESQLVAAVGPRTKAILVSHLHGGVVAMPEVLRIARERNIAVLEDTAQMPGALIHGKLAGTWGDVSILSFGGSKLVTAGRGGAVITSSPQIAQRIKLYTQRGNEAYPLSEMQAAALVPQWADLSVANAKRTASAIWLCDQLKQVAGLTPFQNPLSDSQPGYYKLGLQYDPVAFDGLTRNKFAIAIRAEGIAIDPGFRALHTTHASRRFRAIGELPIATQADERVLTLHHPILLGTHDDLREILSAIEKIRRHARRIQDTVTDECNP